MSYLRILILSLITCIAMSATAQTLLALGVWQQVAPHEWRRDVVQREEPSKLVALVFVTIVKDKLLMKYIAGCSPNEAEKNSVHVWEAGEIAGLGTDCDGDESVITPNATMHKILIDSLPEPAARVFKEMQKNKIRTRRDYT